MMAGRGGPEGRPAAGGPARHIPVMLREVLDALNVRDDATYIDATFGAGGYARAILEAANCRLIAIDRDPRAIAAGAALAKAFPDRLTLIEGRFGALDAVARKVGANKVAGVVLDVGVSSMQLDEAERGFSFREDGPLDMRMGREGPTAADIVNTASERRLADILYHYGEERRARAIARAIVAHRQRVGPITRTRALADLVVSTLGPARGAARHPATRTFQALRIAVNDELGELARALFAAERILAPRGRLVVVTFHSLEDRIVKRFLAARAGRRARPSRHLPEPRESPRAPSFQILNQAPLTPSKDEVRVNPRARSARLRAAERTGAPAWPPLEAALGLPVIDGG